MTQSRLEREILDVLRKHGPQSSVRDIHNKVGFFEEEEVRIAIWNLIGREQADLTTDRKLALRESDKE